MKFFNTMLTNFLTAGCGWCPPLVPGLRGRSSSIPEHKTSLVYIVNSRTAVWKCSSWGCLWSYNRSWRIYWVCIVLFYLRLQKSLMLLYYSNFHTRWAFLGEGVCWGQTQGFKCARQALCCWATPLGTLSRLPLTHHVVQADFRVFLLSFS